MSTALKTMRGVLALAALAIATFFVGLADAALAPVPREAAPGRIGPATPNVFALPDGRRGNFYSFDVAPSWICTTNALPIFAFTWTPPNPVPGLTFSSSGLISGTPTTAGSYSAPGTVIDVSGRTGACTAPASFTYTLDILPPPPVCSVSASNLTPGVNTNVTLTASCTNSPVNYVWSNCSSTSSTCTTTRSTAGAVTYSVNAGNAGGLSNTATVTVTWTAPPVCTLSASNPNPTINTSITLTASCTNSPTSYSWSGCSSSTSTCTTTNASAGLRTYSVTASNAAGTSPAASVNVNWRPPLPVCSVSASNTAPPVGSSVTLTASCTNSPTSYAWTNCSSTASTCTATSASAGTVTYSVVGTNAAGSSNTAQVAVTWNVAVPTCSITAPSTATVGSTVLLSATCTNNPTAFIWTGCTASGSTCPASSSTPGARTYGVTATNSAGTGPQATAQITWTASTVPACSPAVSDAAPKVGSTITVTANCTNSPTSYAWTGCTSSSGATCSATSASEGTRTYTVTATNASGSGTGSVTATWQSAEPPPPPGANSVKEVTSGGSSGFSALIRDTGTLWTWGDNSQGALGDGSSTSRSTPTQVTGLTNIKAATVGGTAHTLALDTSGKVWAWGANTYGEVGNGTKASQTRPVAVSLPSAAIAVAAGAGFSLALLDNHTVYAWGRNNAGQLGDGSGTDRTTPVLVTGLTGVTSIAASANHAAAVSGGNVYVWGDNFVLPPGQSGRPVQAPLLANVIAVFAGGDNTFALKSDGSLWGFGNPADGRLGDGGISDGKTPVAVKSSSGNVLSGVKAVAAGEPVSMALLDDGSLVGWGKNDRGQLGLGHMSVVTTAVRLSPNVGAAIANAAAGASNLIVDTKGRMYAAGSNERGSLGLGDTLETRAPATVPGLSAVTAVATTPTESLALRSDGVVLSWGSADSSTALTSVAAPRPVPGLSGRFIAIAGGRETAVAVRDDGAVFGWGASVPGVSATPVVSPVAIAGLSNAKAAASGGAGVIALTNTGRALVACGKPGCPGSDFGFADVIAVAAGESHFLVLRADKSVWAWGANDKGQLGSGGTSPSAAPVRVANLANVRTIAAGADFSVAVREDGNAFAWGLLPSFASVNAAPVRVSGLDGAMTLAASSHVISLDQQGRGRAWGVGSRVGERNHLFPGREPRMDGMKALAAGVNHSLGVTANGNVVAWGRNFQQQLAVARSQALPTFVEVPDPANSAFTQGASPVVEFLNPSIAMGGKTNLTHFFMTAYPAEIDGLDNGTTVAGWKRTGRNWRAWQIDNNGNPVAGAPASAKPVYRFFSSRWNSHFYTAVPAERDALIAKNPTQDDAIDWKLESTAFYAVTPDSTCPSLSVLPRSPYMCTDTPTPAAKDCPAGYYPVFRAYSVGPTSTRPDPNHQFTSSWIDIYRNVRFAGYVYEGVAFCSPVGLQPGGDLQAYHTYPGDKVEAGQPMQSDFWFGNAGPGDANKATLVAALPSDANWTATCRAYNGATCPADLSPGALRQGVEAPTLPAGGVVHIMAAATAPAGTTTMSFTSSIGAPSGAPDPFANNNASPVSETAVFDGSCRVTLSSKSLALISDGASGSLLVDAPQNCAWSITSDQPWASIAPASGTGPGTLRVTAAANSDPSDRLATVSVAAGATVEPLAVRQPGLPPAQPCASISLGRLGDVVGGNAVAKSVSVVTPSSCAWQASTSDEWLAIAGMSALGTGQIEYVVQPNPDFRNGRIGNIVVTAGGKTLHVLSVTQASGNSASDQGGEAGSGGGDSGGSGGGGGGDGGGDGAGD